MSEKDSRKEVEQMEIRSDEVQEVLSYIPHWIVRWGITILLLFVIVLVTVSWYFKYPDIVFSGVSVTTEHPPASIVARTSGKISQLFVSDHEEVAKDQCLAIIENTSNHQHIWALKSRLDSLQFTILDDSVTVVKPFANYRLGEIQTPYSTFLKSYADYINFTVLNFHNKKITATMEQIQRYKMLNYRISKQTKIQLAELKLGNLQFSRDSALFAKGVIASKEFEKAQASLLEKKYTYENAQTNIANAMIQMSELEQNLLDFEKEYQELKTQYKLGYHEAYDHLLSEIDSWEQKYLLYAPIDGIVTFTKIWSKNQNVASGDRVLTIVPFEDSRLVGKINLPVIGSGKVRKGQPVNIKFYNYPYMEFGIVRGEVKSISLVPSDNNYIVEVFFPDSLTTNYGKKLDFTQEMQGAAEIITEDVRLFERLVNPLKSLLMSRSD